MSKRADPRYSEKPPFLVKRQFHDYWHYNIADNGLSVKSTAAKNNLKENAMGTLHFRSLWSLTLA